MATGVSHKVMKGQVFTIAKLHYVNGVVYFVAEKNVVDIKEAADNFKTTTPSGNAKHPLIRVRTLSRFAEGLGLLTINDGKTLQITELGTDYHRSRHTERWSLSSRQKEILRDHILSDHYRTETIYAITSLLKLIKNGYTGMDLAQRFSIEIGKATAWKSDITFKGFTRFHMDYIKEIELSKVDDATFLLNELTSDSYFQENVNQVQPIDVPSGRLPRSMPRKIGKMERYSANPRRSKTALEAAGYMCALDSHHQTFTNRRSRKPYMEAHHLIPMQRQGIMEYDIDVPENILCLCPNCHRKMHLAEDATRRQIIQIAYQMREGGLESRGIAIDYISLLRLYGIQQEKNKNNE